MLLFEYSVIIGLNYIIRMSLSNNSKSKVNVELPITYPGRIETKVKHIKQKRIMKQSKYLDKQ